MTGFRFQIKDTQTIKATKKLPKTIGIASGDALYFRSAKAKKEKEVEGKITIEKSTVFRSDGVTYVTITTPKENVS